jgi:hypothetical protein
MSRFSQRSSASNVQMMMVYLMLSPCLVLIQRLVHLMKVLLFSASIVIVVVVVVVEVVVIVVAMTPTTKC